MPLTTLTSLPLTLNSTSTTEPPPFTVLTNCFLEMFLNGLLNKPKHNASRMVLLPAPFSPIINVDELLSNCISVKLFPVERKFFHRTNLNVIKVLSHSLLSIEISSWMLVYLYLTLHPVHQYIAPTLS